MLNEKISYLLLIKSMKLTEPYPIKFTDFKRNQHAFDLAVMSKATNAIVPCYLKKSHLINRLHWFRHAY